MGSAIGEKRFMILFNSLQKSLSAGIGRYSYELSLELYNLLKDDIKIIIREEDLKDYKEVKRDSLIILKGIKNSKDRNLCEQLYIPKMVSKEFKDYIVHYPDSMAPLLLNSNKIVITVHDLAFKSLQNVFTKKTVLWKNFMLKKSLNKSREIIAITGFTRDEINRYYKNIDNKINIVYNGFNKLSDSPIDERNLSEDILSMTKDPYILTVSTISPRKNIDTLIKALGELKEGRLIVCGSKGWLYDDIYNLVKSMNLSHRVIFTGKVNDDELKHLYKNSKLFVYPSIYEGFGLPPLEAMSYNVKVILSDAPCLYEVVGDSSTYFKSKDYKDLAKAMKEFLNKDEKYDYSDVLNKYSWKKCGEDTLKVYEKILKGV